MSEHANIVQGFVNPDRLFSMIYSVLVINLYNLYNDGFYEPWASLEQQVQLFHVNKA